MGEETARLRAEIDQTRENLTRDVDLLAEKTSPSKHRRTAGAADQARDRRTEGQGDGIASPALTTTSATATGYYQRTARNDETRPLLGNATSIVSGGSPPLRRGGLRSGSAKDSVTGAASSRRRLRAAVACLVRRRLGDGAVGTVREQAEGNPLAAGLVAFGVGWLVSSLLPASDAEQRAARRAVDTAKEQGQPVLDQAKQAAQEVGQHMQDQPPTPPSR